MKYVFLLLLLLLASCHTVKKTITRTSDTTYHLRSVVVPFDTTVHIKANNSVLNITVPDLPILFAFTDTTISQGGITTTIGIREGKIHVSSKTADTALHIKGTTTAQVQDKTINNTVTILTEEKPSWLQRIWSGIKEFFTTVIIIIAIIVFLLYKFKKSIPFL